ncbi:MAG: CsbD family protein [Syntrophotaleaceae bacterium]
MNSDEMKGQWKQIKGEIRKQWGKLTDDEVDMISGERDKLVGKLQEKYGYSKEEAQRQVDDFRRH